MADERTYFRPNSADELIANSLNDGDIILMNKSCTSLPPLRMLLCMFSKYGISGDGTGAWDHAAMVLRDRSSNVPYLLEGDESGVTLRTFEERLLQGADHQEMVLLPLRRRQGEGEAVQAQMSDFVKVCSLS
jgi:hypothetical protein